MTPRSVMEIVYLYGSLGLLIDFFRFIMQLIHCGWEIRQEHRAARWIKRMKRIFGIADEILDS